MRSVLLVNVSELYLSHRSQIDRTIAAVCRRNRVSHADAQEFASVAHLHLIDNDYAVLRAYQGRAEVGAFLHAVIRRVFQDWRKANWGRWRPSAAVVRMGPVAVQLETLLVRDRRPLHEAIEVLRTNHGVTESPAALTMMAATFPSRTMRAFESIDLVPEPADESSTEYASASASVERAEASAAASRVAAALDAALAQLPTQDRLILKMRFESGATVATISRVLAVDQASLYRRVERLLSTMRAALERTGVGQSEARDVLAQRGFDWLEGSAQ